MIALLSGIAGLLMALTIVLLIRRDRLHARHGTGWLFAAAAFSVSGFAPLIVDKLAVLLDVGYPPVIALTLGVLALVLKVLLMDIERSRDEVRVDRLVQRIAMLEAKLDQASRRDASAQQDDA